MSVRIRDVISSNVRNLVLNEAANGWRYPLVGGTRGSHFDGTNFKPRKLPENAPTPTITTPVLVRGSGARCVRRAHRTPASLNSRWELITNRISFTSRSQRTAGEKPQLRSVPVLPELSKRSEEPLHPRIQGCRSSRRS